MEITFIGKTYSARRSSVNNKSVQKNSESAETEGLDEKAQSKISKAEETYTMIQQLLESDETDDAASETAKDIYTALKIYSRMVRGDIVSAEDEKYLIEYDPDLYMMAKFAQLTAKEHEDRSDESLSETDEENDSGGTGEFDLVNDSANSEAAASDIVSAAVRK